MRTAWQIASLLVDYPTEDLIGRLDLLEQACGALPPRISEPLTALVDHLRATPLDRLQQAYVETFDHTRKGSLYLTYFTDGDTRKRGVSLVRLKQAYRRAGVELAADELPDHLAVVLEFGSTVDVQGAWRILTDYRAGLEVLRLWLTGRESPWADAVLAVSRTLPELVGDEAQAIARLIEAGPPAEDVGLAPYASDPRLDPRLNPLPDYLAAGADR